MAVSRETTIKEIKSLTKLLTGFKEDMLANNEKMVSAKISLEMEHQELRKILDAFTTNELIYQLADVTQKRLIELTEEPEYLYLGQEIINTLKEYVKVSQEALDKEKQIMELVKGELMKIAGE